MILKIKRLVIDHFKGAEHLELDFRGKSARVKGVNGSFKTTCAEAWLWLFADCNYALVKNPSITPLGASECVSRVEADIEIDGKPCQVAKSQKFKSKTDDNGKVTSSVTNTYEINSVEKSYRDFVADMVSRGLDMENFLILSHPFAFTIDTSKAGREKMRSLLFKMTDEISDAEIAAELDNADDLKALLENYRLDEIEQMQKSTLKKISDSCGKDNSVINAKIEGLIASKVPGNIKDLETQLENINKDIKDLEEIIKGQSKDTTKEQIDDVRSKMAAIECHERSSLDDKKRGIRNKISDVKTDLEVATSKYNTVTYEISHLDAEIKNKEKSVEMWREHYKEVRSEVFDENECKCPTCHREYEPQVQDQIRAEFEFSKTERLKVYKKNAEAIKAEIEPLNSEKEKKCKELEEANNYRRKYKDEISKLENDLSKYPEAVDLTTNKEWNALNKQLSELMEKAHNQKPDEEAVSKLFGLKELAKDLTKDIGAIEHNKDIDVKVDELRKERQQAEINRANSEKILDQVTRFKKFKNDKLSDSINSHFKIAQFRLFRTLKNGTTEDACDVLIDGKEINAQANQSLQVLALVDIIAGLQKQFDQHYPVFLDNHALFTSETDAKIDLETQTIKLIATDGVTELTVETEE